MLIEFKVKNFRSFKEEQTFSMVASKLSESKLPDNKIKVGENDFYVLKSASIFGANASGKSNLLFGLQFMKYFISNSLKDSQDEEKLPDFQFALNQKSKIGNTKLELTYLHQDILYRYGFEMNKKEIHKEWLYIDEEEIYTRSNGEVSYFDYRQMKQEEVELKFNMTNEKSLFLTILAATNTKFAEDISNYFKENIIITSGLNGWSHYTKQVIKECNQKSKAYILEMLKAADFNINNLEIKEDESNILDTENEKTPEHIRKRRQLVFSKLMSEHNVYDDSGKIVDKHKFDSEKFESSGTNKFLELIGPIIDTIEKGKILFVDEIDAQLHPLMTRYILGLFNSKQNKQAQIVITTHNATILDNELQRRDQIWFAEKDEVEASHLTSLANYRFKGEVVRADEKYSKNYLKGKYGAIPFIDSSIANDFLNKISEEV